MKYIHVIKMSMPTTTRRTKVLFIKVRTKCALTTHLIMIE